MRKPVPPMGDPLYVGKHAPEGWHCLGYWMPDGVNGNVCRLTDGAPLTHGTIESRFHVSENPDVQTIYGWRYVIAMVVDGEVHRAVIGGDVAGMLVWSPVNLILFPKEN